MSGLNTLLQTLFGTRLPTVMGPSAAFTLPVLSIINDYNDGSFTSEHDVWKVQMRCNWKKKKKKNLMHVTFICEIHRFIPFPHKRPCMMMFRISNNLQLIKTLVLPWRVHNYLKLLCDYQLITLPLSSLLIALMLWLLLAEVSPHNENYSRITYSFFIYQHRAWI